MRKSKEVKEFKIEDLPSTRKEVFFDCLKNRFRYIVRCGIFLLLTCLPLLILYFLKTLYLSSLYEDYIAQNASYEEYSMINISYTFIFDLLMVLSSFVASLGVSGLTRVIRQIAWQEPLFFQQDFIDGIKKNYKQICMHMFVLSLIYLLCDVSSKVDTGYSVLQYITPLIFVFVAIPIFLYSLSQTNVYVMPVGKAIKNSSFLFVKSAPVCVLFSLSLFLLKFIGYINNFSILAVIYILLIMFALPVYYLVWFLYSSYVLDKNVNAMYYPELVDKGITRKKKR